MLGIACLTVSITNFLATFFQQLLSLALVSMTIHFTCFMLPIGMQKHQGISTRSIFQSNMCIVVCNSLIYPPGGIRCNLCILVRSSLNCSPAGIRRTLLLRSSNVPFPSKTVPADVRAFQRGLLFLFVHWFNERTYKHLKYCVHLVPILHEAHVVDLHTRTQHQFCTHPSLFLHYLLKSWMVIHSILSTIPWQM